MEPTLSLGRDTATLLLDDSLELAVSGRDDRGRALSAAAVTWASSDTAVATVDARGRVRTHAAGSAVVSASAAGAVGRTTVTVAPHFAQIVTGAVMACGIAGTGPVYCWGGNQNGELGATQRPCAELPGVPCSATPVAVDAPVRFTRLAAGGGHVCALTAGGAAYCWGTNYYGELGTGSTAQFSSIPTPVAGGLTFTALAAGQFVTCGVAVDGATWCWGGDHFGQLGGAAVGADRCREQACSRTPVRVAGAERFVSLTANDQGTCGLTAAGAAYCWGRGVGGSDAPDCDPRARLDCVTRTPVAANALRYTAIRMGGVQTCGRTDAGSLACWGINPNGQFGTGSTEWELAVTPVPAAGGAPYAEFVAGRAHMCALDAAREAYCWGENGDGEVGDGRFGGDRLSPTAVAGGLRFAVLASSAQSSFTCGVSTAGRAYCWGNGWLGQLGIGVATIAATPMPLRLAR